MKFCKNNLLHFSQNKAGGTAIEYAIIAALIGVSLITSVTDIGRNTSAKVQCTGNLVAKAEKIKNPDKRFKRCVKRKSKKKK